MLIAWIQKQLKNKKNVSGFVESDKQQMKDWAKGQLKQMAQFRGKLVL